MKKTACYLKKFTDKVMKEMEQPHPRPIDKTLEEKLKNFKDCPVMTLGRKVYVMQQGRWQFIHKINEFETIKTKENDQRGSN